MMPTSFIAPQMFSYMIKHNKESGFYILTPIKGIIWFLFWLYCI